MDDRFLMLDSFYLEKFVNRYNVRDIVQVDEASLNRVLKAKMVQYVGNTAVISIDGVIKYGANIFEKLTGFICTQDLLNVVSEVQGNDKVKNVVFAWNCPGGSAMRINRLADAVKALGKQKNTISLNTGIMASAAYYVGSQANKVYVDDSMNLTGSIGTKAIFYDVSENYKNQGVKVIAVATGEFKAMLETGTEITEQQIQVIEQRVNELQQGFNNAVSRTRSADVSDGSEVRSGLAWTADKAKQLGLIDGIKSISQVLEMFENQNRFKALSRYK